MERLHELGSVGDEVLKLTMNRIDSKHGILANVGIAMLETGATRRDERFEKFGILGYLLKES